MEQSSSDPARRYREYLATEFSHLGVGKYQSETRRRLYERTLDELVRALFTDVHEGTLRSYGAVLYSGRPNQLHDRHGIIRHAIFAAPEARDLADGIRSFYFEAAGFSGILAFDLPLLAELDLFNLRDSALFYGESTPYPFERGNQEDLFLVRRSYDGAISVLLPEGIITSKNNVWTFKPYQYALLRVLDSMIVLSDAEATLLRSVLRISVHILGPVPGIGATFVQLKEDDEEILGIRRLSSKQEGCDFLSITNAATFPVDNPIDDTVFLHYPLAQAVGFSDGATIIDSTGRVRFVRAWLTPPLGGRVSAGGTRHLTAEAFSALIGGYVIVTSADGPVTVFHGGRALVRTSDITPEIARNPPPRVDQ